MMPDMSTLEWARPWALLVGLQPLIMMLLQKWRRQQMLHYADHHLLPWTVKSGNEAGAAHWKTVANFLAWLFLALALAGPRLPLVNMQLGARPHHEMDIMVLLDVSVSMLAQDTAPQRLQRAKMELQDLLPRLHGERVGLIAFAGNAGLIMPLNRDISAFKHYLGIATAELIEARGTAISVAIELALRKMPADSYSPRAILLLTDAESGALSGPAGSTMLETAEKLRQAEVPLYVMGVGTEQGATITMPDGNQLVHEGADVVSSMDVQGFSDLARRTGGKFVLVSDGDSDWRSIYDNGLLQIPGGKPALENIDSWRELYGWLLVPALFLFVMGQSELPVKISHVLKMFTLITVLGALQSHDAGANEQEAFAAYQNGNHVRAQSLYAALRGFDARMGEGASAYRRKDFAFAVRQFSQALLEAQNELQREHSLFNLGNALFMAGNYRAAADAFKGVLKYRSDNQDARANLALAAGLLAKAGMQGNRNGIPGRRGRYTGGKLGESADEQPLFMDEEKEKMRDKTETAGGSEAKSARLSNREKSQQILAGSEGKAEERYLAAAKKLELMEDKPFLLHQTLIRMEAAREYVPQQEMVPW